MHVQIVFLNTAPHVLIAQKVSLPAEVLIHAFPECHSYLLDPVTVGSVQATEERVGGASSSHFPGQILVPLVASPLLSHHPFPFPGT